MGGDSHQGLELEAWISRVPSDGNEFNGRAACSPFRGASSPPVGPEPVQQGDIKNPNPDRKRTPAHAPHRHAHSGTDMTQVTKTLPASGQSPSSESLPKSLVQAKGWGEAGFASRPCTASAADCGGQRSRTPEHHWACEERTVGVGGGREHHTAQAAARALSSLWRGAGGHF